MNQGARWAGILALVAGQARYVVQGAFVLFILVACITLSCNHDPGRPSKTCAFDLTSFSGITETDESSIVGVEDPDDWCMAPQPPGDPPTSCFALYPPRPNPMGPRTTIRFRMAATDSVFIAIIDSKCTVVRTVFAGSAYAGETSLVWDGSDDVGGARVPPGIYCCVMVTDSFSCHGDIEVQ